MPKLLVLAFFLYVIWLALCVSKMKTNPDCARWHYLTCLGLPTACHKKKFPESHIMNPLFTKLVQSRWLDIGPILFCRFMDLGLWTRQERTWPMTSHLVLTPMCIVYEKCFWLQTANFFLMVAHRKSKSFNLSLTLISNLSSVLGVLVNGSLFLHIFGHTCLCF